ncbi:MAG: transposase [Verrucomicrobiae bacterium]|nr:transposase [Verrucomicrobiae bacterium]
MAHPPRIPVWLTHETSVIYFITFCVKDRQPVLANTKAMNAFCNATKRLKNWIICAAVLMPDHLHLLVSPNQKDQAIGHLSAALKRWIRQQLKATWQWQPGCFDRLLRAEENIQEKWIYMRENPVRAGLVKQWQEWPYRMGFDH